MIQDGLLANVYSAVLLLLNADVETGNLKLGNASTSLYFFQFPVSIFYVP